MIPIKYAPNINSEGLLYEIWWRDDIITDMKTTIFEIQGSTSSILDTYKTYLGMSCDASCISASKSCAGSSNHCIL